MESMKSLVNSLGGHAGDAQVGEQATCVLAHARSRCLSDAGLAPDEQRVVGAGGVFRGGGGRGVGEPVRPRRRRVERVARRWGRRRRGWVVTRLVGATGASGTPSLAILHFEGDGVAEVAGQRLADDVAQVVSDLILGDGVGDRQHRH